MKNQPLVSIGLPTYNRDTILPTALDLLLSQSYKNFEIILSDNASTDKTKEVCRKYSKKDKRIRYYRQKNNIGMYNNFNFVLKKAKGEYFFWATDDDKWDEDYIKDLLGLLLRHGNAVVATSNYTLFNETKEIKTDFEFEELIPVPQSIDIFLSKSILVTYGIIKTDILRQAGGFFRSPWPIPDGLGELVMILRVLLKGNIAFSSKRLLYKMDSGYFLDKYELLYKHSFSSRLIQKIKRYPIFFILALFETYFQIIDIVKSKHKWGIKLIIFLYCFKFFIRRNFDLLYDFIKGSLIILKGFFRKIII